MEHQEYPHQPGSLPGCQLCEWMCHCDFDAIERGEQVQCIFFGHTENQGNLGTMPPDELDDMDEFLSGLVYDMSLLDKAIKKERKRRKKARHG